MPIFGDAYIHLTPARKGAPLRVSYMSVNVRARSTDPRGGYSAMARLLLEDETEYRGRLFGAARSTAGEVSKIEGVGLTRNLFDHQIMCTNVQHAPLSSTQYSSKRTRLM